ncbi:helix-turn-helix domain-containing protein [Cellulomonas hominis]|jgi:predicted ArsR family transcriptional regulator|nr:helix-turn-helix domain-containing protein [Cellulomonas hominis]
MSISGYDGAVPDADPDPTADLDADARALASAVRLRILRLCIDESLTNREIADRLGRNPATVLHHVRTLVDRGFLAAEPVRRGARGSREVPYRATKKSWRAPDFPGKWQIMASTFLEELHEADPDTVRMTRLGVRLSAAEHQELTARVDAFFEELAQRPPTPGGRPYSVLFALHEDAARLPRA